MQHLSLGCNSTFCCYTVDITFLEILSNVQKDCQPIQVESGYVTMLLTYFLSLSVLSEEAFSPLCPSNTSTARRCHAAFIPQTSSFTIFPILIAFLLKPFLILKNGEKSNAALIAPLEGMALILLGVA